MSEGGYSVLRFSPAPESSEPVNVAVCVWNGQFRLHYDPRFRRLRRLHPQADSDLLLAYLKHLEAQVQEMDHARALIEIRRASAQFMATEYRPLRDVNTKVVAALRSRFLEAKGGVREGGPRMETRIGAWLREIPLGQGCSVRSGKHPESFLGSSFSDRLGPDAAVARVVVSPRVLWVFDGVDFSTNNWAARLTTVSFAMSRYAAISEDYESESQRSVRRVGFLFSAPPESDHTEHAKQMLRTERTVVTEDDDRALRAELVA